MSHDFSQNYLVCLSEKLFRGTRRRCHFIHQEKYFNLLALLNPSYQLKMNPYAVYRLPSFTTTYVDGTFPQPHHWSFEHARHKIGDAMSDVFNPYVGEQTNVPNTDVRETVKRFYLDVELPGVRSKDDVTLTWTNAKTLLLQANIHSLDIHLDEDEVEKGTEGKGLGDKSQVNKEDSKEKSVHLLRKERHLGKSARAFTFFVDVNTEGLTARLMNGVLRIIVEKKLHEQLNPKTVEVQHDGS
jgi:HSP20 family molecular chaperone IbpA